MMYQNSSTLYKDILVYKVGEAKNLTVYFSILLLKRETVVLQVVVLIDIAGSLEKGSRRTK
jgi:hypothetical protein